MANKRLNATITLGGAITGALRSALGTTRDGFTQIGRAVTDLKKRQRELNKEMESWRPSGAAANQRLDLMRRENETITTQIGLLQRRAAIGKRIEELQANQATYAANIGKAVVVGGAILAAAGVAFKANSDFQYQMQLIGNTANMTKPQIDALGRSIIQMSGRVGQTAEQMQSAMGFLVAAGLDAGTATKMLESIGRTATAAGADLEDVSRAAFTLNDSLKVAPGDMQRALDILAQAGKEGNVELRDMAKQLPVLGSGFQALKMQGAEAAATMGAALEIARKGAADADEAANNMKNFIAKVMAPDTLKKAKKNFNLDLYKIITDAQTKGKNPFEAAMVAIMKATQGDQKKIGDLFGDMQAQNFIRPMIQNWAEYQRIKDKALSVSGVTDADFAKVMGTSKAQVDQLKIAFGNLKLSMGQALDGPGAGFLKMMTGLVTKAGEFAAANPQLTAGIVGAALAVTGATIAINACAWAWGAVRIAALRANAAFIAVKEAQLVGTLSTLASTLVGVVAPAFLTVGAAIMATPVGWIAAGIAAVVAGGVMIYKYWEPLKAFFVGFGQGLVAGFAPIAQAITDAFAPVVAVIGPVVRPILSAVGTAVGSVVHWFGQLLTPITAASETTKSWGQAGKVAGQAIATALKIAMAPLTMFLGLVQQGIDKFKTLGGAWQGIKRFVTGGSDTAAGTPPKRAFGGPVRAGQTYMVGERRPELFVPNTDGRIMPRVPAPVMAPRAAGAAGNDNRQYVFNINAAPGQSPRAIADEVARMLRERQSVANRSVMFDRAAGY